LIQYRSVLSKRTAIRSVVYATRFIMVSSARLGLAL
jgi:hypothetical protein